MLDTLRNFALPTLWEQGRIHWATIPKGSTQQSEEPTESRSEFLKLTIRGGRRLSDWAGITTPNEENPKKEEVEDDVDFESLVKSITEIVKGENGAGDKIAKIQETLAENNLANMAKQLEQPNDNETISYNNHDIPFDYRKLRKKSPREGIFWAHNNLQQATTPEDKNKYAAYRSFHISRLVWSALPSRLEDIRWQWLFIAGANAATWHRLSPLLVTISATASFMKADNEFTKKIRKSEWFGANSQPLFAILDQISTGSELARNELNNLERWTILGTGVMVMHAMLPGVLGSFPLVYTGCFGAMVVTGLAIGDAIGADDPRRSVPLAGAQAEAEDEIPEEE